MFFTTFANFGVNPFETIRTLSLETMQPSVSSMAMHNFWKINVKLNRRVLTVNLLKVLVSQNCATNDVMFTARNMSKSSFRRGSDDRLRKVLMKEKLSDALADESYIRKQFEMCRNRYYKSVTRNSLVDNIFQNMMRQKVESDWKEGKIKNRNKVNHLVSKWRSQQSRNMEENLRNIKYSDKDLARDICDKNDSPVVYGNVEVSENMKEALTLNPKLMCFPQIDPWDMEVAVELGFTKFRYSQINKEKDSGKDDNNEDEDVLNLEAKTVDYGKLIATDLPTIPRHHLPKPSSIKNESVMANLKEEFMTVVHEYRSEFCNEKGYPQSNLTTQERAGIKELKAKVANNECVIFKTDKSSKLTVDSTENYIQAISKHTEGHKVIDNAVVKHIEKKLNDNLKVLNSIFDVGGNTDRRKNNQERVHLASISTNVPAPPLDGFRKDHKVVPDGQESVGPPV